MNYDEFAFINQQLAGMLKTGMPLEGALRQLCRTMRRGKLRQELEQLEADLAKGTPLAAALAARKLPQLYARMIMVGAETNDLPATLTLVADYYQRMGSLWSRLKTVMIYPTIVLLAAFALSLFLIGIFSRMDPVVKSDVIFFAPLGSGYPNASYLGLMMPSLVLFALICAAALIALLPRFQQRLLWVLPGFKDAALSRLASALHLMLKSGCSVKAALELLQTMEAGSPVGAELKAWQRRVASGQVKFNELAAENSIIPPLFVWMVAADNDDWEPGLARAAEIYYSRAVYRADLLLHSALPVSMVFLGALTLTQLISMVNLLNRGIFNALFLLNQM